jgi:hypothetical protein
LLRLGRLLILAVTVAVSAALVPASASALQYIDGAADQNIPVWDNSFSTSPFASLFRRVWVPSQIGYARYAVQWNAMAESVGSGYRQRYEEWLGDVHSLGLIPVLALTRYVGVYPGTTANYQTKLGELLATANSLGEHISYVEAWNEPNNQGARSAKVAAEYANTANGVCAANSCSVVAGDFEDTTTLKTYETTYVKYLTFTPVIWGVHPYVSVKAESDATLRTFKETLPSKGAGAQIWFTEVGAYYCKHGEIRGEALQAQNATYLAKTLIEDTAVPVSHAFYYGFLAGEGKEAECTATKGDDTELYRAVGDRARSAASVLLKPPPLNSGELLAFASNASGELLSFARTTGGEWKAYDLTAITNGNPTVTGTATPLETATGELLVFARNSAGELLSFARTASGEWKVYDLTAMTNGNPTIASAPMPLFVTGGELEVFARNALGELLDFARTTGGEWKAYDLTAMSNGNPTITNTPMPILAPGGPGGEPMAFASDPSNELLSFARTTGGEWKAWNITAMSNGNPTIVRDAMPVLAPGYELMAFASDPSNELLSFARTTGGEWKAWNITAMSNGNPTIVTDAAPIVDGNELMAFAANPPGELLSFARSTNGEWRAWNITAMSNGNPTVVGTTLPIVTPAGELLAFASNPIKELLSFARTPGGEWRAYNLTSMTNGNPTIASTASPIVFK